MTMIDVDTSPLQAAREWRGIGLVAAAMTSGLPMAQAEALEEGDPNAFGSIDEMIAAAVVYGASIGIGRDEAMALLDRTVTRTGSVQVDLPDSVPVERPNAIFSGAVAERSARMADRSVSTTPLTSLVPGGYDELEPQGEFDQHPALDPIVDEPVAPVAEMPEVPGGPTPEQAVAASGEIHLDEMFGPEAPWERGDQAGELESWADDFRDDELDGDGPVLARRAAGVGVGTRFVDGTHAVVERLLGSDKADATARWMSDTGHRLGELTRDGRERLRRSEHAALILAIGGGAILIAIVVALGGALGGSDDAGPGPADRAASSTVITSDSTPATGTAKADATKASTESKGTKAAKVGPMIPPARLTLDVFNAGSKKGYAKEVAASLKSDGYKIGEVTNAKDFSGAAIIYPKDMQREARRLVHLTGVTNLQVAPGDTRKITIVVT
jgi:hypothetical protein